MARVCVVIGANVWTTHRQARGRGVAAQEALWELAHRVNARYVFDSVTILGGFWVKLAQGGSVLSIVPDAYGLELSRLQDAMPADPIEEVQRTLREELGPDWQQSITRLDPTPLGSATIAQVHRATLRLASDGSGGGASGSGATREVEIVLKVQHRRVAERLDVDIHASTMIAVLLGALAPTLFKDLRPMVRELAARTRAELDFRAEAANQARGTSLG